MAGGIARSGFPGFFLISPIAFFVQVSLMNLTGEEAKAAESYMAVASWLPPVASFVWLAIAAAKASNSSWASAREYLKTHILLTQPALALFCGSAVAVLATIGVDKTMTNDEVMLMSLFAIVVFLICAWFLPYALKPMLSLGGRPEKVTTALANLLGLLLALMVAIVAFKAREKFVGVDSAINTLIDGIVVFLAAAMAGAGALLAAAKVKRRNKQDSAGPDVST